MFYTTLLTSGKLQSHLADVEEQAQELFDRLMKQRLECEGITENLKTERPMLWVGRMNTLREAVYGNCQCRGDLRMRKQKYYLYFTAEERRYIFNALLAYRNKLIAQGRYTDAVAEVMIKLRK